MKIAIIGAGNVGGALGKLWAAKGQEVTFGVRDPHSPKVRDLAQGKTRVAGVPEAAAASGVVVLAVPWKAAQESIRSAGDLTGKILVDAINPLLPDLSGLALGTNTSAAEEIARWAKGAKVVKAFNTLGAANFANPHFGSQRASMFICGDDPAAKSAVSKLAAELDFDVVDAGGLTSARSLEPLALLWINLAFKQGLGPTGHAFKLLRR